MSAYRAERRRRREIARQGQGLKVFDLHVPIIAYKAASDGSGETPKPVIYGTAFPIAPGLLATAAHVLMAASADGTPGLMLIRAGKKILHCPIRSYELIDPIDLGVISCPTLAHLPSVPIDFDRRLDLLTNAFAIGFPMAPCGRSTRCIGTCCDFTARCWWLCAAVRQSIPISSA